MNPPGRNESVHDIVRRATDAAFVNVRTDIQNLERVYSSIQEKNSDNAYEVKRAKEILESLRKDIETLETGYKKLEESISDLPLMRKLLYYPVGLVLTGFMLWLLSRSGWGVSK